MHGRLRMIAYLFSCSRYRLVVREIRAISGEKIFFIDQFDQFRLIHRHRLFSFWITIFERYRKGMSSIFWFSKRNFLENFDEKISTIFYHWLCKEWFVCFFFFLNVKRNERCVFLHVRCTNPYFPGDKDWNYECVKR